MLHAEIDARQPEARNMPEGGAGAAGLMGAEIWAQVAQHLEVREWARVAGTCRATWDVQLDSINVREWLPLEGWYFLLERCHMAKSAEVHLARGDASGFLGASKGDPRAFENLEALKFECLSPGNTKEHRIRMALDQLAQACSRSLKIASMGGFFSAGLGSKEPFRSLCHLTISSTVITNVKMLHGLPALETLSIEGRDGPSRILLDLGPLKTLKHLHLANFAPRELRAPAGCQLHASWERAQYDSEWTAHASLQGWLQSRLWASLTIPLSSFTLRAAYNYPEDNGQFIDDHLEDVTDEYIWDADRLTSILSLDAPFEHISLSLASFGTAAAPLGISESSRQGLLRAKTVRIQTSGECHLRVSGKSPAWENLSLEAGGVLRPEFHDLHGALSGLDFLFQGCRLFDSQLWQVPAKLAHAGQVCHVARSEGDYIKLTNVSGEDRQAAFDRLLYCGCHCCQECLFLMGLMGGLEVELQHTSPFGTLGPV